MTLSAVCTQTSYSLTGRSLLSAGLTRRPLLPERPQVALRQLSARIAGHVVTINSSGATGGGSVLAYANGSIALGAITATGGIGTGGSVNLIGNGITVGAVNTTANTLSSSGSVLIQSGLVQQSATPV